MDGALFVLALFGSLYALHVATRYAGPWLVASLYIVLPLLLTPYFIQVNELGPFPWIKAGTMLVSVSAVSLLRYATAYQTPRFRRAIIGLLIINILEAAMLGLIEGDLANILNSLAGLVLVAIIPRQFTAVEVTAGKAHDLQLGVTRTWVIGYTAWNWTFVYLNYPLYAGHHLAVLAASLLPGLVNPKRWLQARAYTLGGYLILVATFGPWLRSLMDTSNWADPKAGLALAFFALAITLTCLWPMRTWNFNTLPATRRTAGQRASFAMAC